MAQRLEPTGTPFAATSEGVRVRIRLSPRASRAAIAGVIADGAGGALLKVAVTAPPTDGEANAALVRLLARAWRVPKSAIAIVAGAAERTKVVVVSGEPQALLARLAAGLDATA